MPNNMKRIYEDTTITDYWLNPGDEFIITPTKKRSYKRGIKLKRTFINKKGRFQTAVQFYTDESKTTLTPKTYLYGNVKVTSWYDKQEDEI